MSGTRRMLGSALVAGAVLCAGLAVPAAAAPPRPDPGFVSGPSGPGEGDLTDPSGGGLASGSLINDIGEVIGEMLVFDDGPVSQWVIDTSGAPAGLHGLQLHDVGQCRSPFTSVGARIAGVALPPIDVASDGSGSVAFQTGSAALATLAHGNGFSLVLHDRPDNRGNVPERYFAAGSTAGGPDATTAATGDVGAPLACAVAHVETGKSRTGLRSAKARLGQARRLALARRTNRADPTDIGHADLARAGGAIVGSVDISPIPGGQGVISVLTRGLAPGVHGLQLHSSARCSAPGPRLGNVDLPDLVVAPDGTGFASFSTALPALAGLLAGDGTSFVVQAGPDNHQNIPTRYTAHGAATPGPDAATVATGDAGANLQCGRVRTVPLVERFIDSIYGIVLSREPSRAEVAKWTQFLSRHSRFAFVDSITHSAEARGVLVDGIYDSVLGRAPGRAQRSYWTAQLARPGVSEIDLVANLLGSSTVFDVLGNDVGDFVVGVFGAALGRDPGRSEMAIWNAYLSRGGRRTVMAGALLRSTEARTAEIVDAYREFVGIDPDPDETSAWLAFFRRGGDSRTLRTFLLSGPDFYEQVIVPAGFGLG